MRNRATWQQRQLLLSKMLDVAIKMQQLVSIDDEFEFLESQWYGYKRDLDALDDDRLQDVLIV